MRTVVFRIAIIELLFVVTFLSGIWLSRILRLNDPRVSGNPVTNGVFGVHKIVALLTLIVVAVTIRKLQKGIELGHLELAVVIIAGSLFLVMFVSGILLSLGKARSYEVWIVHKVVSALTVIPTTMALYRLIRGKS